MDQIGSLRSEIEEIKRTLASACTRDKPEIASNEALRMKLQDENKLLQSQLQSSTAKNREITEECNSLKLVVKLLSKELYDQTLQKSQEDSDGFIATDNLHQTTPIPNVVHSKGLKGNEPVKKHTKAKGKRNHNESPASTKAASDASMPTTSNKSKSDDRGVIKDRPQIVIAGDSLLKDLQGHRMSKSADVKIHAFSGSTTEDMRDHVRPLLRRNPHMNKLILHVGTNSLKDHVRNPRAAAEEIVGLVQEIKSDHPDIDIAVSGIVCRSDNEDLRKIIPFVNKTIQKFCHQNEWSFIDNSTLNHEHLNRSKLHLTKIGTSLLAKHFISFIRGDQ